MLGALLSKNLKEIVVMKVRTPWPRELHKHVGSWSIKTSVVHI